MPATQEEIRLSDGSVAAVRPIEPADRPLIAAFYDGLSDSSRRRRFLTPADSLSEEDLEYLTDIDHRRHEALIALDPELGSAVGVARYVRIPGERESGEVAVVVADDWHRRGLGTALLDRLSKRARENGLVRYTAVVSPDNEIVLAALERAGAARTGVSPDGEIEFSFELPPEGSRDRLRAALRAAASAPIEFLSALGGRLPVWRRWR
jgi:RimJ/RimL family protein N-acetyltransferase